MSGKKRSQVQAALNAASQAANAARALLAEADARSLRSLGAASRDGLRKAEDAAERLPDIPSALSGDEIGSARASASSSEAALGRARLLQQGAADSLAKAKALDRAAENAFAAAQAQLDRAQAALSRKSGEHYMDHEFDLATEAAKSFDVAQREAAAAKSARSRAISDGQVAVEAAAAAVAAAIRASGVINAGVAAAEDRRRREEEARRIAEEARRRAASAVAGAASAVSSLPAGDARKFAETAFDTIQRDLADAESALRRQDSSVAQRRAEAVQAGAQALLREVTTAREELDRRQAEAEGAIAGLASALDGADRDLIQEWSDAPASYRDAAAGLESARRALAAEDFDSAVAGANVAAGSVRKAMEVGADARAANERRTSIGQAVMDVLAEMNFDVSFEAGTRDEPLRISGQTADESGRGDFDLAIPLDGEVDFEVTAAAGDTACVAAVNQLREKLAERGVPWRTTDWGQAADAANVGPAPTSTRMREKTKEQTRTRTR